MIKIISTLFICFVIMIISCNKTEKQVQHPYFKPLKPVSYTANVVVLEPKKLGEVVIRAQRSIGVEIQVAVEEYFPRALSPILLINDKEASTIYRLIDSGDKLTTIGFLVENPALVKEEAELAIQMDTEERSRAKVPGKLKLKKIKPLEPDQMKKFNLPTLEKWLMEEKK